MASAGGSWIKISSGALQGQMLFVMPNQSAGQALVAKAGKVGVNVAKYDVLAANEAFDAKPSKSTPGQNTAATPQASDKGPGELIKVPVGPLAGQNVFVGADDHAGSVYLEAAYKATGVKPSKAEYFAFIAAADKKVAAMKMDASEKAYAAKEAKLATAIAKAQNARLPANVDTPEFWASNSKPGTIKSHTGEKIKSSYVTLKNTSFSQVFKVPGSNTLVLYNPKSHKVWFTGKTTLSALLNEMKNWNGAVAMPPALVMLKKPASLAKVDQLGFGS